MTIVRTSLPPAFKITLVESEQIGTIGVGEATIPPFLDTLRSLDIDEADFIRSTQASFKLGIQFTHWKDKQSSYAHPFGQVGQSIDHHDFYHCFLRAKTLQNDINYLDYSPAHAMMQAGKFFVPRNAPNTPIQAAAYALHIDASLAAKYFREKAQALGVERVEGKIKTVQCANADEISHVTLESGEQIQGDFYFDCSGFRALLIGDALQSPYEDWSKYLMVNRAVSMQCEHKVPSKMKPYTESRAQDYGWTWHIPLQHRVGNGYVFNKDMCSDKDALTTLRANLEGKALTQARFIDFKSGVRRQSWKGNCLAIGLASGFLEPLESTAIHMICRALRLFMRFHPHLDQPNHNKQMSALFNQHMAKDFEEIRDFLILHYCTSTRSDTAFWAFYQNMDLPESLKAKLSAFKAQANLFNHDEALFKDVNWYCVLDGMGVGVQNLPLSLSGVSSSMLRQTLAQMKTAIDTSVKQLPEHRAFIDKHCKA